MFSTLWGDFPQRFSFLGDTAGFGAVDARPHMNADDSLARIFGVLEAFLTQLHASLVLTVGLVRAVALHTCGVLRKFGFYFDMTVYRSHRKLLKRMAKARTIPESAPAIVRQRKDLEKLPFGALRDIAQRAGSLALFQQNLTVGELGARPAWRV